MNENRAFIVERSNPSAHAVIENAIATIRAWAAGADLQILLSDIKRKASQNDALWPALRDFTAQVPLQIVCKNGGTRKATEWDWKDVLTAAFEEETEWAPGLRGGVVMLGARTSKYGKRKMGDLLTFIRSEGDERGVRWSAPAQQKFDEYIPRRAA